MGCFCNSENKFRFEDKGINEKHQHMLVFSDASMRNSPNFTCNCCGKAFQNISCFYCLSCNYNMCKECFDYSGGIKLNVYKDGQVGSINRHSQHKMVYGKSKSKTTEKFNDKKVYVCKICNGKFLLDYIRCWTCTEGDFDACDRCFNETGGKIIN